MRAFTLSMAVVAAGTMVAAQPATRTVTVDDLMRLRSVLDVKLSPDGDQVAYLVSQPSVERNAHEAELYVVPIAGGAPVRVAADTRIFTPALPAARVRWRPGVGSNVSFLGAVEGRPQVFVSSAFGGASRAVTSAAQGTAAYEWSPDGKTIAYVMRDAAPPSPVLALHAPAPPTRLWVQTPAGDARPVTPPAHYVDSFSWAPDGRSIVYSASAITGFTAPYYTRLYQLDLASGRAKTLVDRVGMNTMPQVAPDGSRVAFVTTNERLGLIAPRGLAVVTLATGAIRSYPMNGAWVGEMAWSPDSTSIYVLLNEGTFATGANMFEMPIVRVALDAGTASRVVEGPVVNYALNVGRDGRTLVYREVRARTTSDVVVRNLATGATRTLTDVNPELRQFALGRLEAISWRSFDGKEIWGLLITPPGYDGGRRLPLIVYCHGGPIGGVTYGIFPQFMHAVGQVDPYPVEALVSAGYAVLLPMPRGGSGYGEEGHRAIINGWGEADYRDVMAGVDHLIENGTADAARLGVMGASYGGFMTNWIVTQTDRFRAASASASISDLTDLYYLADSAMVMEEYFGKPWENRESYAAHSPLTFAERVRTPLLLQHGENDPRVPLVSGRKFYEALKAQGKTVEFDIFPRGGHVQYQPVAQRESMRRNLEWFKTWIGR